MNVSPQCIPYLRAFGHEASHWSEVGDWRASDHAIMAWAKSNDMAVVTHDLDFGGLLGASGAVGPSVIQVRAKRMTAEALGRLVATGLQTHKTELEKGALLTLELGRSRVRLLPIHRHADDE